MRLAFLQVEGFVADWRRLKLTDEDLQALEALIEKRPEAGVVMQGTGGLRKVRFAPPSWHTGKSGATRVCYIYVVKAEACAFVAIFAKNEKSNLNARDRAELSKVVNLIRKSLEQSEGEGHGQD